MKKLLVKGSCGYGRTKLARSWCLPTLALLMVPTLHLMLKYMYNTMLMGFFVPYT